MSLSGRPYFASYVSPDSVMCALVVGQLGSWLGVSWLAARGGLVALVCCLLFPWFAHRRCQLAWNSKLVTFRTGARRIEQKKSCLFDAVTLGHVDCSVGFLPYSKWSGLLPYATVAVLYLSLLTLARQRRPHWSSAPRTTLSKIQW